MRMPEVGDVTAEVSVFGDRVNEPDAGHFDVKADGDGAFSTDFSWEGASAGCTTTAQATLSGIVSADKKQATAARVISISRDGECEVDSADPMPCGFTSDEEWAWVEDGLGY